MFPGPFPTRPGQWLGAKRTGFVAAAAPGHTRRDWWGPSLCCPFYLFGFSAPEQKGLDSRLAQHGSDLSGRCQMLLEYKEIMKVTRNVWVSSRCDGGASSALSVFPPLFLPHPLSFSLRFSFLFQFSSSGCFPFCLFCLLPSSCCPPVWRDHVVGERCPLPALRRTWLFW